MADQDESESNLFLFGAGASRFSPGILPHAPPLGPQLFEQLHEADPFFGRLPSPAMQLFGSGNFEGAVGLLDMNFPEYMPTFQRLMAKYFTRYRPDHQRATYYHLLFRSLISNDIGFGVASLNYEVVAEMALQEELTAAGYSNRVLGGIFKPHGSCNFILDFGSNHLHNVTVVNSNPHGGDFLAPVRVMELEAAAEALRNPANKIAPAISNYGQGKRTRNSAPFIDSHRAQLATMIEQVKNVIIVGVFCDPESDPHLWNPIKKRERGVWVINPDMSLYSRHIPPAVQLFSTFEAMVAPSGWTTLEAVLNSKNTR
ncbi:hypothetical protein [Neorhizobium petrolearium]|uniref:SIR2-like domain-containing protein n=1 Tax=Neorhizobium petrolearium TaxID=515361 RepID=A0ABY8LZL0_9HYPH|nr:hypothetical protein [Neorhizobium petrolearium]MCC2612633.1 hypothetical protein [Neorhizobium petrolearium]WGI67756.1 hypothetical protein QEO92_22665 [Neorhizobium petrolearium]